ncbi:MAG: hypothetical protein R6W86_15705 [Marinobacter sp.]|uniref:hypothetical protein n=1 Tax=Marinobacter sp. TaxID=50741 RepID=UPI00396E4988
MPENFTLITGSIKTGVFTYLLSTRLGIIYLINLSILKYSTMKMKSLLKENQKSIALVVGNGVNLYGQARNTNSWIDLLVRLAKEHLPSELTEVPKGISLTEFYDVLDLKATSDDSRRSLQKEFCELMEEWKPYDHHRHIVNWAKSANAPILTTNFESTLSDAGGCSLYRTKKGGFTDFYPWENYFGVNQINKPGDGFGVWHVNGTQHYHRSVRLGLSQYMGSVQRARGWLHQGGEALFSGIDVERWYGARSWLNIIFTRPLLIFGLSLEENEVFLRWLLIERALYFKKFPERKKKAWYVYSGNKNSDGKQYFLKGVGVEPVHVRDFDDIYSQSIWV